MMVSNFNAAMTFSTLILQILVLHCPVGLVAYKVWYTEEENKNQSQVKSSVHLLFRNPWVKRTIDTSNPRPKRGIRSHLCCDDPPLANSEHCPSHESQVNHTLVCSRPDVECKFAEFANIAENGNNLRDFRWTIWDDVKGLLAVNFYATYQYNSNGRGPISPTNAPDHFPMNLYIHDSDDPIELTFKKTSQSSQCYGAKLRNPSQLQPLRWALCSRKKVWRLKEPDYAVSSAWQVTGVHVHLDYYKNSSMDRACCRCPFEDQNGCPN